MCDVLMVDLGYGRDEGIIQIHESDSYHKDIYSGFYLDKVLYRVCIVKKHIGASHPTMINISYLKALLFDLDQTRFLSRKHSP